jgi:hypothetical protein
MKTYRAAGEGLVVGLPDDDEKTERPDFVEFKSVEDMLRLLGPDILDYLACDLHST